MASQIFLPFKANADIKLFQDLAQVMPFLLEEEKKRRDCLTFQSHP